MPGASHDESYLIWLVFGFRVNIKTFWFECDLLRTDKWVVGQKEFIFRYSNRTYRKNFQKIAKYILVILCAVVCWQSIRRITYFYSDPIWNIKLAVWGIASAFYAYYLFLSKMGGPFQVHLASIYRTHVSYRWGNQITTGESPEKIHIYVFLRDRAYMKTGSGRWIYFYQKNLKEVLPTLRDAGYQVHPLSIQSQLLFLVGYIAFPLIPIGLMEILDRKYHDKFALFLLLLSLVFFVFLFKRPQVKRKPVRWFTFQKMKPLYLAIACGVFSSICLHHAFEPIGPGDKQLIKLWRDFDEFPSRYTLQEMKAVTWTHGSGKQKNLVSCARVYLFEKENGLAVEKFHTLRRQIKEYYVQHRCPVTRKPASK